MYVRRVDKRRSVQSAGGRRALAQRTRRRVTVLLGTVALAFGVLTSFSPNAGGAASCTTKVLNVVAHYDDDLFFLNPDIQEDITAGRCVQTMFVTAGDAGYTLGYVASREDGIKAAYARMAGQANTWNVTTGTVGLDLTLAGDDRITLKFLRLPEGAAYGYGYPSTGNISLMQLWKGDISSMTPLSNGPTFTRTSLISYLTQQMNAYGPNIIRIQAKNLADNDLSDHSDHIAVAKFAYAAHEAYSTPHSLYWYEDYSLTYRSDNLTAAQTATKQQTFLTYAPFDAYVCQTLSACGNDQAYFWLQRRYVAGSEFVGGAQDGTRIEAESSTNNLTFVSGNGTGTGSLSGWSAVGGSVTFNVNTATTGLMRLRFRHTNTDTSVARRTVVIDGTAVANLNFGPTGGSTVWGYSSLLANLSAGPHTVQLLFSAGGADFGTVGIDHLVVDGPVVVTPPPAPTTTTTVPGATTTTTTVAPGNQTFFELEDNPTNLTFETAAQLGGTGRGSLGYWFSIGDFSRFTTNLPAGTYNLRYRYAGLAAATRTLFIDNIAVATPSFAPTGGWGTWRTIDIPVTLNTGPRTIELRRTTTNTGEINVDNVNVVAT